MSFLTCVDVFRMTEGENRAALRLSTGRCQPNRQSDWTQLPSICLLTCGRARWPSPEVCGRVFEGHLCSRSGNFDMCRTTECDEAPLVRPVLREPSRENSSAVGRRAASRRENMRHRAGDCKGKNRKRLSERGNVKFCSPPPSLSLGGRTGTPG